METATSATTVSFTYSGLGRASDSLSLAVATGGSCADDVFPTINVWQQDVTGTATVSVADKPCVRGQRCCVVARVNSASTPTSYSISDLVSGDVSYRAAISACNFSNYRLWAGPPALLHGRGLARCSQPAGEAVGSVTATTDNVRVMLATGDACAAFASGDRYEFLARSRAVLSDGESRMFRGFPLAGPQTTSCLALDCPAGTASCAATAEFRLGPAAAPAAVALSAASPSQDVSVQPYDPFEVRRWAVTVDAGSVVGVECRSVSTSDAASLTVLDGSSDDSPLVAAISGTTCPATAYTTGGAASLAFANTGAAAGAGIALRLFQAAPSPTPSPSPTPRPTRSPSPSPRSAPSPEADLNIVTFDLSLTPPGSVQVIQLPPFTGSVARGWRVSSQTGYDLRVKCVALDVGLSNDVNIFTEWPGAFPGIPARRWSGFRCPTSGNVLFRTGRIFISIDAESTSQEDGFTLHVSKVLRVDPSPTSTPAPPSASPTPEPAREFDGGEITVKDRDTPVVLNGYSPSDSETLLAEAPAGKVVRIACSSIDTQLGVDVVSVFDGVSSTGKLLAAWSGQACSPAAVTASGPSALIVFQARTTRPAGGFRLLAGLARPPSPSPRARSDPGNDTIFIVFMCVAGVAFVGFAGLAFFMWRRGGRRHSSAFHSF